MTDAGAYCDIFQPSVAAHRGASASYPENSLAAIKEALNIALANPHAAFLIELDIRTAKDGVLTIMHDPDVSRTTTGQGRVGDHSYETLKHLKIRSVQEIIGKRPLAAIAGGVFPISDADLRVPCLPEVLELTAQANRLRMKRGSAVGLALEVKPELPIRTQHTWLQSAQNALLTGFSALHLGWAVSWAYPPNPTVTALAGLLNIQARQRNADVPLLAFSSGTVGERDIKQLWQALTPEAKRLLTPAAHCLSQAESLAISNPLPRREETVPAQSGSVSGKIMHGLQRRLSPYWVAGSLPPARMSESSGKHIDVPLLSHYNTVNSAEAIDSAINRGATILTTDNPLLAIEHLRARRPHRPIEAAMEEEAVGTNPARYADKVRQSSPALSAAPAR